MIFYVRYVLRACFIAAASFVLLSGSSWAQVNLNLVITEDPEAYVSGVLSDIETEGMSSVRALFNEMGLNNPQNEAAISVYQSHEDPSQKRWTELMGVVESGNALQQYYGYAFIGGNSWIYLRIDFNRMSDTDWVLSSLVFNSEYSQIMAPSFDFLN